MKLDYLKIWKIDTRLEFKHLLPFNYNTNQLWEFINFAWALWLFRAKNKE